MLVRVTKRQCRTKSQGANEHKSWRLHSHKLMLNPTNRHMNVYEKHLNARLNANVVVDVIDLYVDAIRKEM